MKKQAGILGGNPLQWAAEAVKQAAEKSGASKTGKVTNKPGSSDLIQDNSRHDPSQAYYKGIEKQEERTAQKRERDRQQAAQKANEASKKMTAFYTGAVAGAPDSLKERLASPEYHYYENQYNLWMGLASGGDEIASNLWIPDPAGDTRSEEELWDAIRAQASKNLTVSSNNKGRAKEQYADRGTAGIYTSDDYVNNDDMERMWTNIVNGATGMTYEDAIRRYDDWEPSNFLGALTSYHNKLVQQSAVQDLMGKLWSERNQNKRNGRETSWAEQDYVRQIEEKLDILEGLGVNVAPYRKELNTHYAQGSHTVTEVMRAETELGNAQAECDRYWQNMQKYPPDSEEYKMAKLFLESANERRSQAEQDLKVAQEQAGMKMAQGSRTVPQAEADEQSYHNIQQNRSQLYTTAFSGSESEKTVARALLLHGSDELVAACERMGQSKLDELKANGGTQVEQEIMDYENKKDLYFEIASQMTMHEELGDRSSEEYQALAKQLDELDKELSKEKEAYENNQRTVTLWGRQEEDKADVEALESVRTNNDFVKVVEQNRHDSLPYIVLYELSPMTDNGVPSTIYIEANEKYALMGDGQREIMDYYINKGRPDKAVEYFMAIDGELTDKLAAKKIASLHFSQGLPRYGKLTDILLGNDWSEVQGAVDWLTGQGLNPTSAEKAKQLLEQVDLDNGDQFTYDMYEVGKKVAQAVMDLALGVADKGIQTGFGAIKAIGSVASEARDLENAGYEDDSAFWEAAGQQALKEIVGAVKGKGKGKGKELLSNYLWEK